MGRKRAVVVLASVGVAAALQLLAARPGWMSPDSLDMWRQATGERPFTDLHTPLLSWLWGFLLPSRLGPLGPVVVHITLFWLAVGSVSLLVSRWRPALGVLLPWLLLALPQMWVLGYAWKDAALMACLAAAVALFAWLREATDTRTRGVTGLALALGLALGSAALVRWYLLPGVLFLFLAMVVIIVRVRGWRAVSLAAAALAASLTVGMALQALVIRAAPSHNATTALMYDLARLQCKGVPGVSVPPQLVIPGEAAFCDRLAADSVTSLFFPPNPPDEKLRWPVPQDDGVVRSAWLQALRAQPFDMVEVKVEYLFWSLLLRPETYLQPLGNTEQSTLFSSQSGSVGIGEQVGFPSRGGVFTVIGTIPQSVSIGLAFPASFMSGIWLVGVLPLAAFLWRRRRYRDARPWFLILASGFVFFLNFAVISLNAATRLTAPFVVLSLLVSVLAVTLPGREDGAGRRGAGLKGLEGDRSSESGK